MQRELVISLIALDVPALNVPLRLRFRLLACFPLRDDLKQFCVSLQQQSNKLMCAQSLSCVASFSNCGFRSLSPRAKALGVNPSKFSTQQEYLRRIIDPYYHCD